MLFVSSHIFKQEHCSDLPGMRNKLLLYKATEILGFICFNSVILPIITTNGSTLPQSNLKIIPTFENLRILNQITASNAFAQICDYQR